MSEEKQPDAEAPPNVALIEMGKGLVADIAAIIHFYQTTRRANGQDVIKALLAMTAHAAAQNALPGHLEPLADGLAKELVKAMKASKYRTGTPHEPGHA